MASGLPFLLRSRTYLHVRATPSLWTAAGVVDGQDGKVMGSVQPFSKVIRTSPTVSESALECSEKHARAKSANYESRANRQKTQSRKIPHAIFTARCVSEVPTGQKENVPRAGSTHSAPYQDSFGFKIPPQSTLRSICFGGGGCGFGCRRSSRGRSSASSILGCSFHSHLFGLGLCLPRCLLGGVGCF